MTNPYRQLFQRAPGIDRKPEKVSEAVQLYRIAELRSPAAEAKRQKRKQKRTERVIKHILRRCKKEALAARTRAEVVIEDKKLERIGGVDDVLAELQKEGFTAHAKYAGGSRTCFIVSFGKEE